MTQNITEVRKHNSSDMEQPTEKDLQVMKDMSDIVNAAKMGIWRIELFDGEQPRMTGTAKMHELLGLDSHENYSAERMYVEWHSRIHPAAMASVTMSVQKMMEGHQDENTYLWIHPTLGERYVRCGGLAHKIEGKGYTLVGYHYDVTETVKKEREQQHVVESLANTYTCLFHVDLDNDSYTTYNNKIPNVRDYIPSVGSVSKGFEIFKNYLCKPEDREMVTAFLDLTTLDKQTQNSNIINTFFRGSTIEWAEVSFNVTERREDGSVKMMIMGIRDITEQKRAELEQMEKLKASIEANRLKTVLLQNMTHELRTPLNAMFGFSQLLGMPDGSISEQEKAEYISHIHNAFNILSMHIDDVLDLADAEHGNYRIAIGDVCVNDICRNAVQLAETRLKSNVKMYFTSDLTDKDIIKSDGRRIQQVLINYLTNACKHTSEGEIHLHVSTSETPGRLTFSVTDTGEGIPEDQQADIFQRYKKANAMVQGSGIGLNICSVIADKLNAEVKLDTTYTEGARFMFII